MTDRLSPMLWLPLKQMPPRARDSGGATPESEVPMQSHRTKSRTPGIYWRERAKPGSKQRERVYSIAHKEGGKLRWVQTDSQGRDLLTLEAAGARKAELRKDKREGKTVARPTKVTFGEYAETWLPLQTELAPRTVEDYACKLDRWKPLIGSVRLSDLTEAKITEASKQLRNTKTGKPLSANTTNGTFGPLSCLLDDAVADGLIGFNPVAAIKAKQKGKRRKGQIIPRARNVKTQRILSPKEIDSLLDACASSRDRAMFELAIYSGLRQQELLGLVWGDVDFDESVIRVSRQLSRPAKGECATRVTLKTEAAEREVPLSRERLALLREYRAATLYKANADYIFTTATGGPVAWNNADKTLKGIVKRAGLRDPRPTWHDLRHTYASLLIAANVNVKVVSKTLGHSDAGFTLRTYVGLFDKEGSAESIRAATGQVNGKVNQPLRTAQNGSGAQVLPFPGNPHGDREDQTASG